MRALQFVWPSLVTLCLCGSALAHHSFARFDAQKVVTVEGTVTQWQWTNPHTWLYIQTSSSSGAGTTVGIESNSPNNMIRSGVKKSVFKVGDKVVVTMHPDRNPKIIEGSLVKVISVNGVPFSSPGFAEAGQPPPAPDNK